MSEITIYLRQLESTKDWDNAHNGGQGRQHDETCVEAGRAQGSNSNNRSRLVQACKSSNHHQQHDDVEECSVTSLLPTTTTTAYCFEDDLMDYLLEAGLGNDMTITTTTTTSQSRHNDDNHGDDDEGGRGVITGGEEEEGSASPSSLTSDAALLLSIKAPFLPFYTGEICVQDAARELAGGVIAEGPFEGYFDDDEYVRTAVAATAAVADTNDAQTAWSLSREEEDYHDVEID